MKKTNKKVRKHLTFAKWSPKGFDILYSFHVEARKIIDDTVDE